MKLKILLILSVTIYSHIGLAVCESGNSYDCINLNKSLTKTFLNIREVRDKNGNTNAPIEFLKAYSLLETMGIPKYQATLDLVNIKSKAQIKDVIIQEYLRNKDDGMPWLPLSFTLVQDHVENNINQFTNGLESVLKSFGSKMTYNNLFLSYLYVSSVPHNLNDNNISQLRDMSDVLGSKDDNFWDIRIEIHQTPSLRTIGRVEKYLENKSLSSLSRDYATQILELLKGVFGASSITNFLKSYDLEYEEIILLKKLQNKIVNMKNGAIIKKDVKEIISTLNDVNVWQRKISASLKLNDSPCTSFGAQIDCLVEKIDLLKLLETNVFSLHSLLFEKIEKDTSEIEISILLKILNTGLESAKSTGLLNVNSGLKRIVENNSKSEMKLSEILGVVNDIESRITNTGNDLHIIFSKELKRYGMFVQDISSFVDDHLRQTTLLTASNWLKLISKKLFKKNNLNLNINNTRVDGYFRVLNPGMAKGQLFFPSPEDIIKKDFVWDSKAIYYLEKTPAELHKVAGVITADSGSIISHVQLLAANHGLPNVFTGKSLYLKLKELEGKEVFLISLKSGEAFIKEVSKASLKEKQIYKDFHKIKENHVISIERPKKLLKYSYPLKLSDLNLSMSGLVAGTKATGQGELSQIFQNKVPYGVVLPFGVYFEHIKNNGLDLFISNVFKNPKMSYDHDYRKKMLGIIRTKIMNIEFSDEILQWIYETFSNKPFLDKGVFVRSDTNAEDLAGFVGAGLNKTIVNIKGIPQILNAIKEVWSSVFTNKAISWRNDLISNPWEIYPSVIIQLAVDSDKAGVLIIGDSTNAKDIQDHIIIAANEGVGISVVDGRYNPEEVIYSRKNKTISRMRTSYTNEKLVLNPDGGVMVKEITPGPHVLSDDEVISLSKAANYIQNQIFKKYGKLNRWDIEWGIKDSKIILFQIRPFVGNKIVKDLGRLEELRTDKTRDSQYIKLN